MLVRIEDPSNLRWTFAKNFTTAHPEKHVGERVDISYPSQRRSYGTSGVRVEQPCILPLSAKIAVLGTRYRKELFVGFPCRSCTGDRL